MLGAIVLAMLLGWASGGSLNGLQEASVPRPYVILALFVLQGIVRGRLGTSEWLGWGLLVWAVLSGALLLVIALTWSEIGMRIVATGIALNLLVVLANGFMPVEMPQGSTAVRDLMPASGFYGAGGTDAVLGWLGDVLPVTLFGATYALSAGDVLLMVGVICLIVKLMTTRKLGDDRASRLTSAGAAG